MKVDPFHADCCPGEHKDLLLIQTHFVGPHCFIDLQCRICQAFWTAEIGPTSANTDPRTVDLDQPAAWRVLTLHRRPLT